MGVFERRPSREEQAIEDMRLFLIEYLDNALGSIYSKLEVIEQKQSEEVKKDGDVKPTK